MSASRKIVGVTAFSAFFFALSLATAFAAESGTMVTYDRDSGQTYFAVSLTASADAPQDEPRDVVVVFDTSASQTGVYRDTALAALTACLEKLGPNDRVQLMAADLAARPMTQQFVSPDSNAMREAVAALTNETPLGSTDMERVLTTAAGRFDPLGKNDRVLLYVGDGMSQVNLLESDTFRRLVDALASKQISVSSYAIGPGRDAGLLAALANHTGGNLYVDTPMALADDQAGVTAERAEQENLRRGAKVGATMAGWVRETVMWPTTVQWPAVFEEVFPKTIPPLRSDRDSIVVGKTSKAINSAVDVQATVLQDGQERQLQWSIKPRKSDPAYAYLAEVVNAAEGDDGATLPTVGTEGLTEMGRVLNAQLDQMSDLAEHALATGDTKSAEVMSEAVLKRDPGHIPARTVQRVAARTQLAQNDNSSVTAEELMLVRPAQAETFQTVPAEGALTDRFAENGEFLEDVESQKRVFAQMLKREVENTIVDARDRMRDDPQGAIQNLKLSLQNVERAPELLPEVRAQLINRIQAALREAQRAEQVKDELDRERQEELAAARERRLLQERLSRQREKEKQLMDRFTALVAERRYDEAAEVAAIVEDLDPGGVIPRAALVSSSFQRNNYLQQVTRAARWRGFWDTLYQVELSAVPFPDDPPIVYPAAPVWEELTNRRKKYASVDLSSKGGAEERINRALNDPLTSAGLDFLETPLEEVIQFLQEEYEIPIILDTRELEDVNLDPSEPLTVSLRNMSLRSALRLMLANLDLTYVVQDEVLMITTPEKAETILIPKVYPVADLVLPIDAFSLGGGLGGGGLGGGGVGGGGGGVGGGGLGGGGGGLGGGGLGGGGGGFFSVPDDSSSHTASQSQSDKNSDLNLVRPTATTPESISAAQPMSSSASTDSGSVTVIEIDESVAPSEFWNRYFAEGRRDPESVRRTAGELMKNDQPDQVVEMLQAALRHGQPQPWMYEALGIAMQLSGRSEAEVERAVMSAVDFATTPDELMYIAEYLSKLGFDERALDLYRQVLLRDPLRQEAYMLALRAAQRIDDLEAIQWATLGILSQAWPKDQQAAPEVARRVAQATLERLGEMGRIEEQASFQALLDQAAQRDCVVRVSWTGDADVDLYVEEPGGTICSPLEPLTTGGGVALGDAYGGSEALSPGMFREAYICPRGFAGTYRVHIRKIWGEVTAGKVTVEVFLHYGTDGMKHERQQVALGDKEAVVVFDLDEGRRTEPIEQQQLASAISRQQAVSRAVLLQEMGSLSDPGVIPRREDLTQQLGLIQQGAVGYQPIVMTLPEGTSMVARAVISADRRYVRVTAVPSFTSIGEVTTFTFAGAAQQVDDQGDGGDGAAQ